MKQESRLLLRIRTNVTGIVVPLLVMAAYLLGWPTIVQIALTVVFYAGILGTWAVTTDLCSWRADRSARLRRLRRRITGRRA